MKEKCVGAFRRACDNQTDAILCDDCWAYLDRVYKSITPQRTVPMRFSPRPRHGVQVPMRGTVG